MTTCKENKHPKWLKRFIYIAIIIIGLYFFKFSDWNFIKYTFENNNLIELLSSNKGEWGTFGDYVGGVLNPLFSFAALVALLRTIELQEKQISDTNKAVERQQFEDNFFNLCSMINQRLEDLRVTEEANGVSIALKGRDCLEVFYNHLKEFLTSSDCNPNINVINSKYNEFNKKYGYKLSNYFHTFYSTIIFIDNAKCLSKEDKFFYAKLLSYQLSEYELYLHFYSCLYLSQEEYNNKILNLIYSYGLFVNAGAGKYLMPKNHFCLLTDIFKKLLNSEFNRT